MTPLHRFAILSILATFLAAWSHPVSGQTSATAPAAPGKSACEALGQLKLQAASVTLAQSVSAGTFAGPAAVFTGQDLSSFYKGLPAFCRVVAVARPSTDSDIKLEVWLPASGWNGKLQGIGNGGFAGLIDHMQLGTAISQGFAATATDAGHTGSPVDASWALGHPEKIVDFGHRGIHEMTRVAKLTIQAFYGKPARRSYFAGCSDGGREALMEAQRYPEDYDGILAGAPANYWTALLATAVWDTQALALDPASYIPPAKIPALSAAVLAACDSLDGVRNGILNDPRRCHFDPATLICSGGSDSNSCLTAPQAAALKKLYTGPQDSRGHQVFPGYPPGAEEGEGGWALWITGPAPGKSLMAMFGQGYFSNMVYDKADWDYKSFALEAGMKAAEEKTASALNAIDPDLTRFKSRGGKLILYHGWEDPAISSLNTVNYYESVISKMGQREADSFLRVYMVPGMQHCDNGPGADLFGQVGRLTIDDPEHSVNAALENWVEKGAAPGVIVASKHGADEKSLKMTRPLCAYPRAAQYKGGNANSAASFRCEAP